MKQSYLQLIIGSSDPITAHHLYPDHSVKYFEGVLKEEGFVVCRDEFVESYFNGIDSWLLGNLYQLQASISQLTPEAPNLPRLWAEYTKLLNITTPLIERLSKHAKDLAHNQSIYLELSD